VHHSESQAQFVIEYNLLGVKCGLISPFGQFRHFANFAISHFAILEFGNDRSVLISGLLIKYGLCWNYSETFHLLTRDVEA